MLPWSSLAREGLSKAGKSGLDGKMILALTLTNVLLLVRSVRRA